MLNGAPGAIATAVLLFVWAVYLDVRHDSEKRLAAWWVRRSRDWGAWVGPCSFLISAGAFVVYAVLALLANAMAGDSGDPRWALVLTLPMTFLYAPFVLATAPDRFGGYRSWRPALEAAGADVRVQRGIAWWAGPPSVLGLMSIALAILAAFVL